MIRGLCLSTAALVALLAVPAMAQESACMTPVSPTMPDGKTADRDAVIAAAAAVKTFVSQSDEYQSCLNAEYEAYVKKVATDKGKMDPKVNTAREAKITANQTAKENLGKAYTATAAAYRQAHPPAPK